MADGELPGVSQYGQTANLGATSAMYGRTRRDAVPPRPDTGGRRSGRVPQRHPGGLLCQSNLLFSYCRLLVFPHTLFICRSRGQRFFFKMKGTWGLLLIGALAAYPAAASYLRQGGYAGEPHLFYALCSPVALCVHTFNKR